MTYSPSSIVARATVVAGGHTTEYLCAGSGRALLILAQEPIRGPLIEGARQSYRVVAPVINESTDTLNAGAIVELLDGLGLGDVYLVADWGFADLARACSESFPDRFAQVLVMDPGTIDLTSALARLAG